MSIETTHKMKISITTLWERNVDLAASQIHMQQMKLHAVVTNPAQAYAFGINSDVSQSLNYSVHVHLQGLESLPEMLVFEHLESTQA